MQGSARKDVVFGAARVYTATVPGPKWKSWLNTCHVTTVCECQRAICQAAISSSIRVCNRAWLWTKIGYGRLNLISG